MENLARISYETFGAVHLLVNNAGVGTPGNVWECSMDDWHWVMGVNFYGVLHGVRAFIPRMIEQGEACHIVNVASVAGIIDGFFSAYSTSKHAVVGFSETLYYQLAATAPHISISVYCPGYVDTKLSQAGSDERPRPVRFGNKVTDKQRNATSSSIANILSIEESAHALFEGINGDKLYIGVHAFREQMPRLAEFIRQRAENIVNEQNPAIPPMNIMGASDKQ